MGSTRSTISTRGLALVLLLVLGACASRPPTRGIELSAPLDRLEISSPFGQRSKTRPHYGIDLRAPEGTPVHAAGDGRVTYAGWQSGFGRIVMLDHGRDVVTYYAHLSDFAVRTGSRVRRGETIGFVGRSGNATGPHLHFEVRAADRPIDPLLVLDERPH
jgi:murein DD-endopeptidase MepM/ murein hydrolase activator NlpD